MKKLRVTVEGKAYDVLVDILEETGPIAAPVLPTAAQPIASALISVAAPAPARAAAPAAPAAGPGGIPSPLAGKIVSIDVKVGDVVKEGAQVATIEAMKMNTYIFAPKAGKVASIHGNPGDGIEEGAILLRLE